VLGVPPEPLPPDNTGGGPSGQNPDWGNRRRRTELGGSPARRAVAGTSRETGEELLGTSVIPGPRVAMAHPAPRKIAAPRDGICMPAITLQARIITFPDLRRRRQRRRDRWRPEKRRASQDLRWRTHHPREFENALKETSPVDESFPSSTNTLNAHISGGRRSEVNRGERTELRSSRNVPYRFTLPGIRERSFTGLFDD